jgi:hypothetical protein
MKRLTVIEQHDRDAVLAYHRASAGGHAPPADSPIAKAALRAMQRQELEHPGLDFAKAVLDGTGAAHTTEPSKLPVPDNDAVARMRASLAGVGTVDLSGGASTIASDQQSARFLAKMQDAEQARRLMADPATPEALKRAKATAARKGRQPTATDFSKALEEVKAEQGPRPYQPPEPVVQLFAQTAAKATTSDRYSVVPDSFRR